MERGDFGSVGAPLVSPAVPSVACCASTTAWINSPTACWGSSALVSVPLFCGAGDSGCGVPSRAGSGCACAKTAMASDSAVRVMRDWVMMLVFIGDSLLFFAAFHQPFENFTLFGSG